MNGPDRLLPLILVTAALIGSTSGTVVAAGASASSQGRMQTQAAVATPRPIPPIGPGQAGVTPHMFASMSVLQHGRWIKAQTVSWTVIGAVSLRQPLLFTLAVQTSIPGWARTRGEIEVFKAVPVPGGLPGQLEPGRQTVYRVGMSVRSHTGGYTRFSRRVVFSSPKMVGPFFAFIRGSAGSQRFVGHYFFFSIRVGRK